MFYLSAGVWGVVGCFALKLCFRSPLYIYIFEFLWKIANLFVSFLFSLIEFSENPDSNNEHGSELYTDSEKENTKDGSSLPAQGLGKNHWLYKFSAKSRCLWWSNKMQKSYIVRFMLSFIWCFLPMRRSWTNFLSCLYSIGLVLKVRSDGG